MIVSQLSLYKKKFSENPIILIDDFDAELDQAHQELVLNILKTSGFQSFLTMIDTKNNQSMKLDGIEMFHVEHGSIVQA